MLEKLLAKRHIRNLNLSSVREALVEKQNWAAEDAERVEGEYKRFLYALSHKRREDILSPPTDEVDEFWHQHILDTRRYRQDCGVIPSSVTAEPVDNAILNPQQTIPGAFRPGLEYRG